MTNPDPEPTRAPGLEPGSGVPPGETPPAESDSTAGISYPQNELRRGWAAAPLVVIMLVVALVVAGLIAMVVALIA